MTRVRAPELPQDFLWLNCNRPLSLKNLKGRTVILDFWTYGCINCLHVLPELDYLEQKYRDSLTVIGVHSAKFEHEQDAESIRQAIERYSIQHPVLVDSGFDVWQQYAVRAYPTLVVIDPEGYVIRSLAGEGHQAELDQLIAQITRNHSLNGTIDLQELSLTPANQHKPLTTPLAFPGRVLASNQNGLFVADSGHHRLIISTIDGHVRHVLGTGSPGLTDGSFTEAQFSMPQGMALDQNRQFLYVADTGNHVVRRVDLVNQTVKTIAGTGFQSRYIHPHGGLGLSTALNSPWDLELIGDRLLIAMAGSHQIWQMSLERGTIQTYAGTGAEACFDGLATEAAFAQPSGITTNGKELWVADSETSSIRAIELGALPQVRTVCGSGGLFDFGDVDGVGEAVRLQHCLAVEYANNSLWIADTYNHKIKRVDLQTGECRSILGTGRAGFADGNAETAQFAEPSGLSATDSDLYIADTNNHTIRRVNLDTGAVMTLTFSGLCAPNLCFPASRE